MAMIQVRRHIEIEEAFDGHDPCETLIYDYE